MTNVFSGKTSRGIKLTNHALELIENRLQKLWAEDEEWRSSSKTGKLTREKKAERLEINVKTLDSVIKNEGADLVTIQHIFGTLQLVWRDDYRVGETAHQPAPASDSRTGWGSAPVKPSLLVGREQDTREIRNRLCRMAEIDAEHARKKMLVIRGWPGVGKTTIAASLAHDPDIRAAYPDGILWAELGTDPAIEARLEAWARQIGCQNIEGIRSVQDSSALLSEALSEQRRLIIIDDAWQPEHVVPLLVGGGGCAAVVTTREIGTARAIAPTFEDVYHLQELSQSNAYSLLYQIAGDAAKEHKDHCMQLCKELDGLPLAIKVAGRLLRDEADAGLDVMSLLEELRASKRLLLSAAPADRRSVDSKSIPTVELLFSKSTDRLTPRVRDCFALLGASSAKPATFGLGLLEHIWQRVDVKDTVRILVGRGLIESTGNGRFQMHALLISHAQSLLQSEDCAFDVAEARVKTVGYYHSLVKHASTLNSSEEQDRWFSTLDQEYPNFREVLKTCILDSSTSNIGLTITAALGQYWEVRGMLAEGSDTLRKLLANSAPGAANTAIRARALNRLGILLTQRGELNEARNVILDAIAIATNAGNQHLICDATLNLGNMYWYQNDLTTARQHYEACLTAARAIPDNARIANALGNLGGIAWSNGDYPLALQMYNEDLEVRAATNDRLGTANTLGNIGEIYTQMNDLQNARDWYQRSLTLRREIGDLRGMALALEGLGKCELLLQNHAQAKSQLKESLSYFNQIEDWRGTADLLDALAACAVIDSASTAAKLSEAAKYVRKNAGIASASHGTDPIIALVNTALETLNDNLLQRIADQIGCLNLNSIIEMALGY